MGRTGKLPLVWALVLLALITVGCNQGGKIDVPPEVMQKYLADKPPLLHPQFRDVLEWGERDSVKNLLEAGLCAMQLGHYELAEKTIDEALARVEAIFGTTKGAKQARSLWYKESKKDFKGEPYERVMAYYYRGLLYLRKGDFQNARACFKNGALQDAFAEDENNRCDFALMYFLEGWASQCDGDPRLASEAYKEVEKIKKGKFTPPPSDHNTLVIVETGNGPWKLGTGPNCSELKFMRGKGFTEHRANVIVAGHRARAYPMEDIAWQAMTRGGRRMDKIIAGKVQWKDASKNVAKVAARGSLAMMAAARRARTPKQQRNMQMAGLGMAGFALGAAIFSASVQPAADTRYWNNLPDMVHVYTCKLPPAAQSVTATYVDKKGLAIKGHSQAKLHFAKDKGFAWLRSRTALKR